MDEARLHNLLERVPEGERDELLYRVERLTLLGWTALGLWCGDDRPGVGDLCGVPPGGDGVRFYDHVFGGGDGDKEVA